MKLIALILGLIIERAATHLLHLRELRWFDAYFDYGDEQIRKLPDGLAVVGTVGRFAGSTPPGNPGECGVSRCALGSALLGLRGGRAVVLIGPKGPW